MSELNEYREEIDKIDNKIISLLKNRIKIAGKIQKWKNKKKSPIYMPDRELKIYQNLKEQSLGSTQYRYFKNIFREIMSSHIALENPNITIGYLGPLGSFTHQAAISKFGNSLKLISISNIDEVFDKMQTNEISYGIVPLENSQEGIVNETLDNLIEHNIFIYSEIRLPIKHTLISYEKKLSNIKKIYTHRQAFYQCKKWLQKNIYDFEWVETASTSKAVQLISTTKEKNTAAIGSSIASEYYKIPILHKNITSKSNNFTRFIVLSRALAKKSTSCRTSVIFPLSDNPGSLYEVLHSIYKSNINMTCIESRPKKDYLWSYTFYLEIEGYFEDKKIQKVLQEIQKKTQNIKILGSYS